MRKPPWIAVFRDRLGELVETGSWFDDFEDARNYVNMLTHSWGESWGTRSNDWGLMYRGDGTDLKIVVGTDVRPISADDGSMFFDVRNNQVWYWHDSEWHELEEVVIRADDVSPDFRPWPNYPWPNGASTIPATYVIAEEPDGRDLFRDGTSV